MTNNHKDPSLQMHVVRDLISRLVPSIQDLIKLEHIEPFEGKDVFEVDGNNTDIILRGNNPVSFACALNHYLKYHLNVHVSWCGNQLNLPAKLPIPNQKYRRIINQKYRAYMNYCTLNYTAAWWNWERWEREIDFMVLNGINLPLSVIGIEGAWYNTLLKFGFSDEEARSFLVGPAYHAWQWMTNIENHAGPLPKNWIEKRIELGEKIMKRQLEFGMQPIQQGFSGYVPKAMLQKFSDAKILLEGSWCSFPSTAQLDPLDPLFKKFGKVFLEEQKELFGAHHFYAADPFHEGHPPQEGKEYLNKVGDTIFELINEFDPMAKWVMQAWSIRKDIATVVPKEKLLVLDLGGTKYEKTENFWGYDFIAGNLHNFGGRTNLHGDLKLLASNQYSTVKAAAPNVCGTGLFMEGIMQNPVYYELAFEINLRTDAIDIHSWLKSYCARRYGAISQSAADAWYILLDTVYQKGTNGTEKSSIICARPAVQVKKSGPNMGFNIPYDNKELLRALTLLLEDFKALEASAAYRYDIVDILRQVLSNYGQIINRRAANAFKEKDIASFKKESGDFLNLLRDIDKLLSSRDEFSLKKWINDARAHGETLEESDLYEYNASMLVTLWGPLENPSIFDYSWREWSGLIEQYYFMRWQKFYAMLLDHLENGTEYMEEGLPLAHGREAFRANDFYSRLADCEIEWVKSRKDFSQTEKLDEIEMVNELLSKYKDTILVNEL